MGAAQSTAMGGQRPKPQLLWLARRYVGQTLDVWVRFLVYIMGLERHESLVRQLVQAVKYRANVLPQHANGWYHAVGITLVEVWLATIRVLLVPDVLARYIGATFVLHIVFEVNSRLRKALVKASLTLTAKGRRTLRLRRQLENASSFMERLTIAGELDKIEGKDKWREDPSSDLFLYERILNKTQMYKVWVCVNKLLDRQRAQYVSLFSCDSACTLTMTSWESCLHYEPVCFASTGGSDTHACTLSAMVSYMLVRTCCRVEPVH